MIKLAICDNDVEYILELEALIKNTFTNQTQDIQITKIDSFSGFLEATKAKNLDIVISEVVIDNINVAKYIYENDISYKPQLIINTSHPLEAYHISDIQHCHYLIKQKCDNEMMTRVIVKALDLCSKKTKFQRVIRTVNDNVSINLQDIIYIESMNNNIIIHLTKSRQLTVYSTLESFYDTLPPQFFRCHKSFIINMNHIKSYKPNEFTLTSNATIPIPQKKYRDVISVYKNFVNIN